MSLCKSGTLPFCVRDYDDIAFVIFKIASVSEMMILLVIFQHCNIIVVTVSAVTIVAFIQKKSTLCFSVYGDDMFLIPPSLWLLLLS